MTVIRKTNQGAPILDFQLMLQIFKKPHLHLWYFVLFLFGLSVCTSKSLFTLFVLIIILWTMLDRSKLMIWTKNPWIVTIASLFPIAILLSLFSLGGVNSALLMAKDWYWPLIACPIAVVASDRKTYSPIIVGFAIGLFIANVNSFFKAFQSFTSNNNVAFMSESFRITSFWDISRWGFFSGIFVLFLLQLLTISKPLEKLIYGILLSITLIPFLMSNTRAPLLALTISILLLLLSDQKLRKYALYLIAAMIIFAGTIPKYQERIVSIFQVQRVQEKLISSNQSNLDRLNMWKVAFDFFQEQPFFGTGFGNSEIPLRNYLQRKDSGYINSYVSEGFSYRDQHSSYWSTLVQFGLIFTAIIFSVVAIIFVKTFFVFSKTKDFISRFSLIGLCYCFIVFFFYSALSSYEASVFFILLSFGALRISKKSVTEFVAHA